MCNVHGFQVVGHLNERDEPVMLDPNLPYRELAVVLARCEQLGLMILYKSLRPRNCEGYMSGGMFSCPRICGSAHRCKAKVD